MSIGQIPSIYSNMIKPVPVKPQTMQAAQLPVSQVNPTPVNNSKNSTLKALFAPENRTKNVLYSALAGLIVDCCFRSAAKGVIVLPGLFYLVSNYYNSKNQTKKTGK